MKSKYQNNYGKNWKILAKLCSISQTLLENYWYIKEPFWRNYENVMQSEKLGRKSENNILRKLRKMKTGCIANCWECQVQNSMERWGWVFLSALFGDSPRNMSKSSLCHKIEFFSDLWPSFWDCVTNTRVGPKLLLIVYGWTCNSIYRNSDKAHLLYSALPFQ